MVAIDIWTEIINLVGNLPSVPFKHLFTKALLTRQTALVNDLGLIGDDAFEFMEEYATKFKINKGDYEWQNYFEPEALWLLPSFGKTQVKKPITLGMLELAAKMGTWNSKLLEQAYLNNDYK
ncbi:MAG: DUF1493 family protein [Pseudomonadota bacterium]